MHNVEERFRTVPVAHGRESLYSNRIINICTIFRAKSQICIEQKSVYDFIRKTFDFFKTALFEIQNLLIIELCSELN